LKAIDIFTAYYPKLTEKLQKRYPDFLKTASETEVIDWKEEFAVTDRNPEVIDEVMFWNTLLDSGLITKEEWERQIRKLPPASKTVGVAFIETKEVAFRQEVPDKFVLVHEVGHVHFGEVDSFWSSTYGGGEILFWLGVKGRYSIPEAGIRLFMKLMRRAYKGEHKEVAEEIVKACSSFWGEQIYPHFYPICLGTSWIPEGVKTCEWFELNSPEWEKVEVKREDVVRFFISLTEGLKYGDNFWIEYARRLKIIER